MGNGWHEWPLVLFTVLGQCVVGATIVSGLGWLALGTNRKPGGGWCAICFYLAVDGHWFSCFGDASRFTAARLTR